VHAVACDVGVKQRGSAPAGSARAELDRGDRSRARPAVDGHHAVARVDRDDEPIRIGSARCLDELGRAHRGGAEHDVRRAEADGHVDRRTIANATTDLDWQLRRRHDLTDQLGLLRRARERAIEVDDVQPVGAAACELADQLERSLGEHGRTIATAFFEPDRATLEQIERRK
jgi:hypothetical protein